MAKRYQRNGLGNPSREFVREARKKQLLEAKKRQFFKSKEKVKKKSRSRTLRDKELTKLAHEQLLRDIKSGKVQAPVRFVRTNEFLTDREIQIKTAELLLWLNERSL